MCPNFGTPKIINFSFRTNGKMLLLLSGPILMHITVVKILQKLTNQNPKLTSNIKGKDRQHILKNNEFTGDKQS